MITENAGLLCLDLAILRRDLLRAEGPTISCFPRRANGAIAQPISATSVDPVKPDQRPNTNAVERDKGTRRSQSVHFQSICHDSRVNEARTGHNAALSVSQNDESTISFLPSTVPETMEDVVMDGIENGIGVDDSIQEGSISRQTQLSDATQPISQTVYDDVIRSRSEQASLSPDHESQAVVDAEEPMDGELQDSVREGDPNFVDICSSYIAAPVDVDSVPVNFSPTQTQHPPSPFPESQRFKTPATAGRKRDHSGDFIDTPAESRNPFARSGNPTYGNVVGLSQAFANTQAASSPLPVAPTSALRSDKPSPGIEIQQRIDNPATSSPLRPLTDPRRSSEPASKYVPVGQSQLLRMAMTSEAEDNQASQGSMTDHFDSISSTVAYHKKARERELRARKELDAASSPISPQKHNPITVDELPRRAESEKPLRGKLESNSRSKSRSLPSSPPPLETEGSEDEETLEVAEHEDLINVPTHSMHARFEPAETSSVPDEPRRDATTLVPDTTRRATRSATQPRHVVQPSPSEHRLRHRRSIVPLDLSSNPIRVANSQKSVPSTQEPGGNLITASLAESVDVIPASPDGQLQSTEPLALHQQNASAVQQNDHTATTDGPHEENYDAAPDHIQSSGPPNLPTIPETSSSNPTVNQQRGSTYTTAPTNQATEVSIEAGEWSSQPVRTTPPGRKRKRLGDISQEEVPPNPTQSSAFDPSEALALDQNPEVAKALSSQDPDPIRLRKRARPDTQVFEQHIEADATLNETAHSANIGRQLRSKIMIADGNDVDEGNPVPSSSLSELPNPPNIQRTPSRKPPPKSVWSPGDSPQHKPAPSSSKPGAQLPRSSLREISVSRIKRPTSKTTLKTPKRVVSTLPSIEEASPNPLAINKSSSAIGTPAQRAGDVNAPQMVFVYFMGQRRAYYPAICQGYASETGKYTIVWPGYDAEHMARHSICSLDLRVGDEVRVERENWPKVVWKVHGFGLIEQPEVGSTTLRDIYGHSSVMLEPKNAKVRVPKGVKKDDPVPISDIYLDSNQWGRMNKRPFVYPTWAAAQHPAQTARASTPRIRTSTPSTPSSRSRQSVKDISLQPAARDGIFSNMAFALSFSENIEVDQLTELVSEHGGTIVQPSFRGLVTDDIELKSRFSNMTFGALLADKHSRKEKYMQALAMGLPCLSGKWVEMSVKHQKLADWQDYLLPAGESNELGGAVRSRIMAPMDMKNGKLSHILESRPRFFTDANVIFVTGRGKVEVKRRAYLFFVQIVGAAKVEEVTDLAAAESHLKASEKKGKMWLIVEDKEYANACKMVQGINKAVSKRSAKTTDIEDGWDCRVADGEFVVQSLILGRLCERHTEP